MLHRLQSWKIAAGVGLLAMFVSLPIGRAQDRGREGYRDRWDRGRSMYTELAPGTTIPVRTTEPINVERRNNRVYYGIVNRDVRGDTGHIAIPRGSNAELIVRVAPDNDLILDLESVVVNGQRYAIRTEPNRVESRRDNSLVGAIVGAVNGGEVRGRAVRIPRNSVVAFRLERPLDIGIVDRGVEREGHHYHDWYDDHDRH
jgi:hypothetical protein